MTNPHQPELPAHIGLIVGVRLTPANTNEFFGYFEPSYKGLEKERVYTASQMREYGAACATLKRSASAPTSAQAGAVPEGFVLVPRWKLERAAGVLDRDGDEHGVGADIRSMIASTPTPTAPSKSTAKRVTALRNADAAARASDAIRERDLLAEAIANAGMKCGLLRKDIEGLTGPQLLLVCDDMATALTTPSDAGGEKPPFDYKGFGLACTIGWTELVKAMRADGHDVKDSSGPNTRKWMEQIVRDTFAPTPPNPGDARMRELAERWEATANRYDNEPIGEGDDPTGHKALALESCADDLLSLLDGKGVPGG